MLQFPRNFQKEINRSIKRQKPNWFAFFFVVAFTFVLFNQPHDGKLQVLSNLPYFFEGGCSLLVAYIGIMFASKPDIYLREFCAIRTKAVSTGLEMSMPIVDALETFIRIVQQVSILIKIKNTVNFKSIVVTSILAVTRLQIKLGGILHACLTPRLTPAPSYHLA